MKHRKYVSEPALLGGCSDGRKLLGTVFKLVRACEPARCFGKISAIDQFQFMRQQLIISALNGAQVLTCVELT